MIRSFIGAALLLAATAFGAHAADEGDGVDWTKCRTGKADDRIASCSEIISSGKVTGDKIAFAYRFRGDAYVDNARRDDAIRDYRSAIEADPAQESIYLNSMCWANATLGGKLEDAMRDCNRSIQLKGNAHNYNSRGLVNLKLAKDKDALRDYELSLKLLPKSASSLYGRSIALRRLGRKSEADADKNAAIALDGWIMHKFTKWGVAADGSVG